MSAVLTRMAGGTLKGPPAPSSTVQTILRLLALAVIDVFALLLAVGVGSDGNLFLAVTVVLVTALLNVVNLVPALWPLRWISPSLALIILLAVYPLLYTVYVAFTNFSDGHRFTKIEAADLLSQRKYLPEGSTSYAWTPYRNEAGDYGLWLADAEGQAFFALPGAPLAEVTPNESGEGPYDRTGAPASFNGYALLEGGERFQALAELQTMQFGDAEQSIGIKSRREAGAFESKWVYDPVADTLTDRETGTTYRTNDSTGDFVAPDGSTAPLGYWVFIGTENFTRIFSSSLSQGPLVRVFLWTVAFALFSTLTAFAMGLTMALILNDAFPGVRFIRSLLIVPYAIPGMIGILIWRGMMNGNVGVITTTMDSLFGWAPPFSSDPGWAKFAILLVNLWFAYPYFMLIGSGALQAIPTAIYEAADVDGANNWIQFWRLTLPLLLVSLGPLLIASFIFNFNNYLLLEALFQGGPPMAGTSAPPVGHTDNLMTHTYRLAFSTGGTRDFGLASALAVLIFLIVGVLTLFQFRLTRQWEEVSENV